MDALKISGVILVVCIVAVMLSKYGKEYSFALSAICVLVLAGAIFAKIAYPLGETVKLLKNCGIKSEYLSAALKTLAIGYISKFTADICNDNQQSSLASAALFAGKTAIFIVVLPLVTELLNTVYGIMK